jgi:Fic family protein
MLGRLVRCTWTYDPTLYAPARYRRACRYDAFVPRTISDLPVELPGQVAGVVSDAESAIQALNASAGSSLAPLARLLLRTESIASSKVEGLQVDARSLARAESRADGGGRVSQSAAEVLANIDAMQLAVDDATAADAVTLDEILGVHRVLLAASSRPDIAGQIRTTQNWIGGNDYNPCGAAFVPPPPQEIDALLEDLCAFCNEEALPPIAQAAIAHAQFETIHPFPDGNGRTGRALVHAMLRGHGLTRKVTVPVSAGLLADTRAYFDTLTAYRDGDPVPIVEMLAQASLTAMVNARQLVDDLRGIRTAWDSTVKARKGAAAWRLADLLLRQPVVDAPTVAHGLDISPDNAMRPIAPLVEAGVLTEFTGFARNRMWQSREVLCALDDFAARAGRRTHR